MEEETSPDLLLMVGSGNLESVRIGDEVALQFLRNGNEQKGKEAAKGAGVSRYELKRGEAETWHCMGGC